MSCSDVPKRTFWWLWRECPPLPIPNREVKPPIADDTAHVRGKVGRRQSLTGEPCERFPFFCFCVGGLSGIDSIDLIDSIEGIGWIDLLCGILIFGYFLLFFLLFQKKVVSLQHENKSDL